MDNGWGARVIISTTPVMDTEQTYEEECHTLVRQGGGLATKVPSHSTILRRVVVALVHTSLQCSATIYSGSQTLALDT